MSNLVVGQVVEQESQRIFCFGASDVRGQYHEFRMCITTFGDGSPPRHFDGCSQYFFEPNYGRFAQFWITVLLRTESTIIIKDLCTATSKLRILLLLIALELQLATSTTRETLEKSYYSPYRSFLGCQIDSTKHLLWSIVQGNSWEKTTPPRPNVNRN